MPKEDQSSDAAKYQSAMIVHGAENCLKFYIAHEKLVNNGVDACYDSNMLPKITSTEPIWRTNVEIDKNGAKTRFLTDIRSENVDACKKIMREITHIELRHLEGVKGNFTIHDNKEIFLPFFVDKPGVPVKDMLYCTEKEMVDTYTFMFDNLWRQAIPAKQRIKEIEEGVKREVIETIRDPNEILKISQDLVKNAREEIMILFSTANAFRRQEKTGLPELLERAATRGIEVRIIVPIDDLAKDRIKELKQTGFDIRGNQKNAFQSKLTTLIVDNSLSLTVELKDDTKESPEEAIGLATYSNSESTVLSYVAIFETLWSGAKEPENKTEELQQHQQQQ
jgi:sugar-specific transcriptional regulator TrmB